jgi:hypothetical protein
MGDLIIVPSGLPRGAFGKGTNELVLAGHTHVRNVHCTIGQRSDVIAVSSIEPQDARDDKPHRVDHSAGACLRP